MADASGVRLDRKEFRLLLAVLSLSVAVLLYALPWHIPQEVEGKYWNGLLAFTILAVACDLYFLPVSRISPARVSTSVVFIPLLATVPLFDHPWPMLISGATAAVAESTMRKPLPRAWFNVAQYMLAVGLGDVVYRALGGAVGLNGFQFSFLPFCALVITYFIANQGSVALAVASTTGMSVRTSWSRIVGGSLIYDLAASSFAVLLAYLYADHGVRELAILIVPLLIVRHVYQMNLQAERVNRELLELMVKAIEARDPYTSGHSLRVSEYARHIARELGLFNKQVEQIANAALLHDVGKIHEDFAPLLRKDGKLSPEERILMQDHPVRSADLVGTIAEFRGAVQSAIKHHHENFDGTGYPEGLAGAEIPVGARIIMIADTLDAMTTDRPYRKALTPLRALEELSKYSGNQFDPKLVGLVQKSPNIRRLLGAPASDAVQDSTRPVRPWRARSPSHSPVQG